MNMNGTEDYDLVVLASGAGDKVAAWTLGGRSEKVAVIERKAFIPCRQCRAASSGRGGEPPEWSRAPS